LAGASTGSGEAVDLRDGGSRFGGADVMMAVGNINGAIARTLRGRDARDQKSIDDVLIALDGTPNKARLGANALVGTSMAMLHAAAAAAGLPLYAYLLGDRPAIMPIPEIQIFGGGAHARRRVDIQDFMVVAPKARSFAEALEWTAEIYRAAGAMMSETGRLQGVADEGGFSPAFDSNEAALCSMVASPMAGHPASPRRVIDELKPSNENERGAQQAMRGTVVHIAKRFRIEIPPPGQTGMPRKH
jgi:enolase